MIRPVLLLDDVLFVLDCVLSLVVIVVQQFMDVKTGLSGRARIALN